MRETGRGGELGTGGELAGGSRVQFIANNPRVHLKLPRCFLRGPNETR